MVLSCALPYSNSRARTERKASSCTTYATPSLLTAFSVNCDDCPTCRISRYMSSRSYGRSF